MRFCTARYLQSYFLDCYATRLQARRISKRVKTPKHSLHQAKHQAKMLALRSLQRSSRLLATRAASTTPVALVGCGMPGRGMGWYHVARGVK